MENNRDNDENPQSSNCEGDGWKPRCINSDESGLRRSKMNEQIRTWRPPWRIYERKIFSFREMRSKIRPEQADSKTSQATILKDVEPSDNTPRARKSEHAARAKRRRKIILS